MGRSTAYISFSAQWDEPISAYRLKLATLLYDELVFVNAPADKLSSYAQVYGAANETIAPEVCTKLDEVWRSIAPEHSFSIYGPNDRWPWDTAPTELRAATSEALQTFGYREPGDGEPSDVGDYELYKYGGYTMSDVLYWHEHYSEATFVGSSFAESILRRYASLAGRKSMSCLEIAPPEVLSVCWRDLLDLRRSPFLEAFRKKYAELANGGAVSALLDHYQEGLERLSDTLRPSIPVESVKAVLSNIPFLPINPAAMAISARDVYRATVVRKDYGWVFFLRDLRKRQGL